MEIERLDKMELLLAKCEKDLKKLEDIKLELEKMELSRSSLEAYYDNEYMEDYDAYVSGYRVVDQDSIWNVLAGQYIVKKEILKLIANTI